MTTDYTSMMDDLRAGKLSVIEITPTDFPAFRKAWTDYPARDEIVGKAKRGGIIDYRYQSVSED